MPNTPWEFAIDVGGTFTDVVARRPDGQQVTHKLLSSGVVRGTCAGGTTRKYVSATDRVGETDGFWTGFDLTILDDAGCPVETRRVARFEGSTGRLFLESPLSREPPPNATYELSGAEEAPVLAIRYLMGLCPGQPIGHVAVRLGTTRATNALLERKGGSVAFVTTRGFGDILRIGNQDRPRLFDLAIRKRDELYAHVVEIDERIDATGCVLRVPQARRVHHQLVEAHERGVNALAVCLLHAHVNPDHERLIEREAAGIGFNNVSISSSVCRMEKLVARGDTTVVDAYVGSVITDYVAALRRSLPDAHLLLMTSNGGLVDASSVNGKDTILSGPAGGVIGCDHVIRRAGFDRAIGFDMGGTSTDVSRIDPLPEPFEYQDETVKAGVRIMAPMLAIETVAAGGGSFCAFDGAKLVVGPKSAGADPGPACYGRGGPLTVTDVNVLLGRIDPRHFPFRLDRRAIDRRLASVRSEIIAGGSPALSDVELADGFRRIANANMAAAIKRISIAKGYDIHDYVLCSFGGAGGQHACAIARSLGIRQICISPDDGVLSAIGIGVAEVKRVEQRSVSYPLDESVCGQLEEVFGESESRLRQALLRDGIDANELRQPVRSWSLRYHGQAADITVPFEDWRSSRESFERRHVQSYGYRHEGRAVEVRAVRVELSTCTQRTVNHRPTGAAAPGATHETTTMFVDGRAREVAVFSRDRLATDQIIVGPAIVAGRTGTAVIDLGWEAKVNESGDLIVTDKADAPTDRKAAAKADPVRLELFNNRFASIADQMGTTLRRTAFSTNVKERLDYSCALFDAAGELVVNAPHIPVHLGGMSHCVQSLIADVGRFEPGDVYITNDPYRGGSHLNDITVITPVFEGDRVVFFVASRAHHAEIGGTRPGSMPPDSTNLAQEGVVIRAFPWVHHGATRDDALRALLTDAPHPSRTPEENLADIAAQTAANQTGVRELQAMVTQFGLDLVRAFMGHIQAAAEHKMRAALAKLPDGVHQFEDALDDGATIRLALTIAGDSATIDFSGTDPVLPGNFNANPSIVASAVLYCLRCLIDEDIPLNAGVLAPVSIILPTCFLNPSGNDDPRLCPAVVGGNVETSQRIVDCVFGALGTVAASQGTMNNLLMGNESFGYYETICGGSGAGLGFAGADAVHTHMTNTRATDPEILESRYPVRLIRFAIRRGSGGSGVHRGGDGAIRELEFLEPLELSILSQRRNRQPYGLHGGAPGAAGRNLLQRAGDGTTEELPAVAHISVMPGDRLTIETPGGGAYGTHP